jgi:dTDP-4-dehydrorhamnose 3,5-epimerase
MRCIETDLPGVVILEPEVFADPRGCFFESYHARKFADLGITAAFVQDNHSHSGRGTLRGLHYQLRHPQAKLCRVVQGEVFDVAVDVRRGSPTFGQWTGVRLSAENHRQIFIPTGYAHGFLVLSGTADFLYKCDDFYSPGDDYGVAWNDPLLAIQWPLEGPPLLSNKDHQNPTLADAAPDCLPVYPGAPAASRG